MPALDMKTREMVALAASVAANCTPCLKYHFSEAVKKGCTAQEIEEIVKAAVMVKQRPAADIDELCSQLMREMTKVKE